MLKESTMLKRRFAVSLAALGAAACLALFSGCAAKGGAAGSDAKASDKVSVVASFYPMYDFAQKIGGDRVDVTCLVPAGVEPHDWEPSTADMKTIASAQVLVYSGAGMEHWVEDVTSAVGNKDLAVVEASKGVDLLAVAEDGHDHEHADEHDHEHGDEHEHADEHDHEHADVHDHDHADEHDHDHADHHDHDHGQYDPHVWLSPANVKVEMANIRDALIKADPAGQSTYEKNYEKYAGMLDALDKKYAEELSKTANKNIVVSHQAFGYLCNRYGLTQVPIEGIEADSEPDAKSMAKIVDFVKQNSVKTIFSEELVSPKAAQAISAETGAAVEVLNPLEGLTDEQMAAGEDYFSVMESNLSKLVKALS